MKATNGNCALYESVMPNYPNLQKAADTLQELNTLSNFLIWMEHSGMRVCQIQEENAGSLQPIESLGNLPSIYLGVNQSALISDQEGILAELCAK